MRGRALSTIVLALACAHARADVPLVAVRVDAANHAALAPGGPDATGGAGDWALSNGTLCAVVADPAHESDLAAAGGALVDLGHCGRGDDQLVLLQPLANLDRRGAVPIERVEPRVEADAASLTTFGTLSGCAVETRYALDARDPARLLVATRITRREAGARLFAFGDVVVHAQHGLRPFAVDSRARVPAAGFEHPGLDLASAFSVAQATRPADTRILVGARAIEPGIAYALRSLRAERSGPGAAAPVSVVSLSAETFSGIAAFADRFWLGADRLGPVQMAQTLLMDLSVGESLLLEREILVSPRADAASLTDRLFEGGRRVRGRVADAHARIAIRRDDDRVATDAAPDAAGRFSVSLPPGAYRARVLGSMGGETLREFQVGDAPLDLGDLEAPPLGALELPRGAAMRLVFRGAGDTPDPRFGDERPAVAFGADTPPASSLARDVSLAGVASDPASVSLPPGRYRVSAGRGPEFGVNEAEVEIVAGGRAALAIAPPERALATPGWISADLHVHAAPSDDSALPLATRVATYVAEGAEVMVATDHELVTDYAPLIRELGVAGEVASVVGQEVTSSVSTPEAPHTFGHANAFPLPRRPTEYRAGGLPNEARRLRDVIDTVRGIGGERIVQLNHARSGGDTQGFFDHLSIGSGFDPRLPLELPPNAVLLARAPGTGTRDVDFDAMELLNGPSMERYRQLREDWFALLRHGIVRTGTANSDSHLLREVAGAPRNLVRLEGDTPERFDEAGFVRAIRAGRVVGTSGPILDAHVGDAAIGETHRGREGAIRIDVAAAPWVPVSRVRAYVNGVLAHETDASNGVTVWFPHRFDADAFVTVEAEGEAAPDSLYAARLPGFTPFAFTNPIFVDADGDGVWRPGNGAP
jgi:hypothetical protein